VTLVVAVQCAQPIEVDTNAAISTPRPAMSSMQTVIVVIPSVEMPISAYDVPATAIPTFQDSLTVKVATNSSVSAPIPSWTLVVVVFAPEIPVCPHSAPVPLVVHVQHAQAVEVDANAPEPAPSPLSATMEVVVVVVLAPQMPVAAHVVPP